MKPPKINPNSLLLRIRAATSRDEIAWLLQEGGGYGKAKDSSIRRWRTAAKKRLIELGYGVRRRSEIGHSADTTE